MNTPPITKISWNSTCRIISTRHPPIDLFEDLLDPEDWEAAISLESKTNPRLAESIGMVDLVPVDRRVSGPGASYLMAPFTHVSPEHQGRFHDGNFGAYYAARDFETAVSETSYHQAEFFKATDQEPGWFSQYRELVGQIDANLHDIRSNDGFAKIYDLQNWQPGQTLARQLRSEGSDGIAYSSVRNKGGECIAVFWPNVLPPPIQGRSLSYHFDGDQIDIIRDEANGELFRLV